MKGIGKIEIFIAYGAAGAVIASYPHIVIALIPIKS